MEIMKVEYYSSLIDGMDEDQAVDFAIAAVREAIDVTQRTNERLDKALDLMEARHLPR